MEKQSPIKLNTLETFLLSIKYMNRMINMNYDDYKYELIIYWSEEDNAFLVEVPELPGCIAD